MVIALKSDAPIKRKKFVYPLQHFLKNDLHDWFSSDVL